VYVGTITSLHKEHTMLAIEAGKHVLCEKPLAESAADAAEMYAAAEAKGIMLQEGAHCSPACPPAACPRLYII
jgi:predicted dehydrogenase